MSCPVVECMRSECISKCGPISWFGNLSDCDVTLQYQLGENGLWHSLGQYPAGMHTELGGGALYLPSESNIRVIETPVNPSSTDPPRIIQNWGQIGSGLPSLYIDNSMCSRDKNIPKSQLSACPKPRECPSVVKKQPLQWVIFLGFILSVISAVSIWLLFLIKKHD